MSSTPSAQQLLLRSSAQGYRSNFTTTNASRLRDSCHGCAASKVKCTKEKPTCSRCARRGTRCEYLITKRPGRRHDSRTSDGVVDVPMSTISTNDVAGPATLSAWQATFPMASCTDSAPSLSHSEQQPNPSTFSGLGFEFDEFFSSPLPFSLPDTPNLELLDAPNTSSSEESTRSTNTSISGKSHSNPISPEDIIYLFGERSRSLSLPSDTITGQLPSTNKTHGKITKDFETSHRCFPHALNTLNKLFADDTTACMMSLGEHSHNKSSNWRPSSVQTVISRNEHAINEMSRILQCSCSTNSVLLTIVALVVFKALDWYAVAARMATAGEDDTLNGHPYSSLPSPRQLSAESAGRSHNQQKDKDYDRQPAQLVLVELHRVQRFLSQLSPKLQACGHGQQSKRASTSSGHYSISSPQFGEDAVTMASSPFSSVVLEQLEPEMRKRMGSLSAEIIAFLRRD